MVIQNILDKIKQNWLAVVLLVVLVWVLTGSLGGSFLKAGVPYASESMALTDVAYDRGYYPQYGGGGDFAPEEEERKIEKTASLSTDVKRGEFDSAEQRLKGIVASNDGLILNQNVRKWSGSSRTGSYSLKVPTDNYDRVVADLQDIGDVESFNENSRDVTGQYLSLEQELETEKARLERYKTLYAKEGGLEARLNLEDRIFNQERRIEYLEKRVTNMDQRIEYSSIQVTLKEEQSGYERIGFVKISELVKSFVKSTEGLLFTIAYLLPWAIVLALLWVLVRFVRSRFG